jgi:hypothetical protein
MSLITLINVSIYWVVQYDTVSQTDYNCHYGVEFGTRCLGATTRNALYLHRTIHRHNCSLMDLALTTALITLNIYKHVLIIRFIEHHQGFITSARCNASGPVSLMYEAAKCLDIHIKVVQSIMDGTYMSRIQSKCLVKEKIRTIENKKPRGSCIHVLNCTEGRGINQDMAVVDICLQQSKRHTETQAGDK